MQYEVDRAKDTAGEPSLAQMTEKAIKILQKNDKGFFLLVEGTRPQANVSSMITACQHHVILS